MDALEKLGWTRTAKGIFPIVYRKDDLSIVHDFVGWFKVARYKSFYQKDIAFQNDELLALAEIIKEEEKK